jgi:hypothetical protein
MPVPSLTDVQIIDVLSTILRGGDGPIQPSDLDTSIDGFDEALRLVGLMSLGNISDLQTALGNLFQLCVPGSMKPKRMWFWVSERVLVIGLDLVTASRDGQ